ncbi:hypothetical protein [Micromonospora sp. NPDC023956]|uniref:hypothetical protein n=1 Tax=Micromonospora sp. NPDC023956 TaxID=3155722 RepID=UPI0033EEF63A
MNDLERRYRRLLRAYPPEYRRTRGDEIVGTYLDLAGPHDRRPSLADAADLLRGGLRQRLRAAGATDVLPGVRLAATLALTAATVLAAGWFVRDLHPPHADLGYPSVGPFASVGVLAWVAWLLAAVVAGLAPGRSTRVAVAVAVLLTVAVVPLGAVPALPRPALSVLAPQIALGLLTLALPAHPPIGSRWLPALAGLVTALATLHLAPGLSDGWGYYGWTTVTLLSTVGVGLLVVVALLAAGLALARDTRGLWATLTLLGPVGLLTLHSLAGAIPVAGLAQNPTWASLAGTAVVVSAVGVGALPSAVLLRRRVMRR